MTLAEIDPFFVPITHLSLPRGRVLECTTSLDNTVRLELQRVFRGTPLRYVDVLEAPIQYGPSVLMYALPPENATRAWSIDEVLRLELHTYALYPGVAVYLVDLNLPNNVPVDPFVIDSVRVA